MVGLRSRDGEVPLELLLLSEDDDRCRVSLRTSSRLTLSCEYGASDVSRISTNLEEAIVVLKLCGTVGKIAELQSSHDRSGRVLRTVETICEEQETMKRPCGGEESFVYF